MKSRPTEGRDKTEKWKEDESRTYKEVRDKKKREKRRREKRMCEEEGKETMNSPGPNTTKNPSGQPEGKEPDKWELKKRRGAKKAKPKSVKKF